MSAPRVLLVGAVAARLEPELLAGGVSCIGASTAEAAVRRMRETKVDAVIVPEHLPDLAGNTFARGALQHFPDVFVVLMGGELDGKDLRAYAQVGRLLHLPPRTNGATLAAYLVRRAQMIVEQKSPKPI